jgi:hypothetical protein
MKWQDILHIYSTPKKKKSNIVQTISNPVENN